MLDFLSFYAAKMPTEAISPDTLNAYLSEVKHSIVRQYIQNDQDPSRDLRASALGKPAVIQAINMPRIQAQLKELGMQQTEDIPEQLVYICHMGDVFEAWARLQLVRYGYEMIEPTGTHLQHEIEFEGVTGHIDILCQKDGRKYLVECKTMSDYYFKQFMKKPDDQKGYLTQLAVYAHCLGIEDDAYWLCQNRSTLEIGMVQLNAELIPPALERARKIITLLRQITCLEDFDGRITSPPGELEIYRKNPTGKLLVPSAMRYCPYVHLFYNIEVAPNGYGKPTNYCGHIAEDGRHVTNRRRMADVVEEFKRGVQP